MAYFYAVETRANQGYQSDAAKNHENALNAYLDSPTPSGKKRHVHRQSTVQVVINMSVITTTFLCCDEDDESEEKGY